MMSVVVIILIAIVSSILLPSGDQISDISLWYNTVNFYGNGFELFGCRACFRRETSDSHEKGNRSCKMCFNSPINAYSTSNGLHLYESESKYYYNHNDSEFRSSNETIYRFNYGQDPCHLPFQNKALAIELSDQNCQNLNLRYRQTDNDSFIEGDCQSTDICCINRKLTTKSIYKSGVKDAHAFQRCIRNSNGCELCIAEKRFGRSCLYLSDVVDPLYNQSISKHLMSYPWQIRDRKCTGSMEDVNYRINNLKVEDGTVLHLDYQNGVCNENDECCLRFRNIPGNISLEDVNENCFDSVCSQHLNTLLRFISDKEISLEDWKKMDLVDMGNNLGGKLCSTLEKFGYAIMIPITINTIFGIWHCYKDARKEEALYLEVIFALIGCYPQYKLSKLLIRYACGAIHNQEFMDKKARFEGEIASIEPFVESVWQVNISFAIVMCLDGFFPHDENGFASEIFSNFIQILPAMSFCLSAFASAFGISKFYMIGPLRLISQDSPLSGICSFSFLGHLFLNFSFVLRIYAIEHSLFSEYIISSSSYSYDKWGITTKSIPAMLHYDYRLTFYLIPILPSLILNIISLHQTLSIKSLCKLFLNFPQYLITSCFTPLIFKGAIQLNENTRTSHFKLKTHRIGSMMNAIYIMFIPQVMLIISDVWRGIIDWKFTSSDNKLLDANSNKDLETNSGLTKHPLGNILFAIAAIVSNAAVLIVLIRKNSHILSHESDILGSKGYEEKHWNIFWHRIQIQENNVNTPRKETEERIVSVYDPRLNDNLEDEARVEESSNEENVELSVVSQDKTDNCKIDDSQ